MSDTNHTPSKPYGVLYLVRNLVNGKEYVGQTRRTLERRWRQHCSSASTGCRALSSAISKYGADSFEVVKLATAFSKHELDMLESAEVDSRQTLSPKGYNLKHGGGSRAPFSEESRRLMSSAHRTEHLRDIYSNLSKKRWESPDYRSFMAQKHKEHWSDPEKRSKSIDSIKASRTPELLREQSIRMKAFWANAELREKALASLRSEESRKKKSDAAKSIWLDSVKREAMIRGIKKACSSEEHRQRMSVKMKSIWTDEMKEAERIASWERIESPHLPPRADNKNGARGVRLSKAGKWIARVGIGGGKQKHLGCFDTMEEARQAYISAKMQISEEVRKSGRLQLIRNSGINTPATANTL